MVGLRHVTLKGLVRVNGTGISLVRAMDSLSLQLDYGGQRACMGTEGVHGWVDGAGACIDRAVRNKQNSLTGTSSLMSSLSS